MEHSIGIIGLLIWLIVGWSLAFRWYRQRNQSRAENAELRRMVTNTEARVDRIESAIESGDIHGEG